MQAIKNNHMGVKNVSGKTFNYSKDSEKVSFVAKLINSFKSIFNNNNRNEVSTMENRKEIKNFNKKVQVRREEINTGVRLFTMVR